MFGLGILELLILALAAYRLTVLFTQDRITAGLRNSVLGSQVPVVRQWGGGVFGCNNCFGVWASAAVLSGWVYLAEHDVIRIVVIVFAVAGAQLLFSRIGRAAFGAPPARSPVDAPAARGPAGETAGRRPGFLQSPPTAHRAQRRPELRSAGAPEDAAKVVYTGKPAPRKGSKSDEGTKDA